MGRRTTTFLKITLSALHFSGLDRLLSPLTRGVGVIFMLHRVRPRGAEADGPNRILEVTPEFLEETIRVVQQRGFEIVSLDELHARILEGDFDRRFAAFTFDDGYRDNREFAYPIFRRHGLPLAIYVPTEFPDGNGDLWWIKLEQVIACRTELVLKMDGVPVHFDLSTRDKKDDAFSRIYWWLRDLPEAHARRTVAELCEAAGIDATGLCRALIMDWQELRDLAADPLVTVGAHTCRHMALSKLSLSEAHFEMSESIRRLERELGRPVRHFSYPYGDETSAGPREFKLARELGLDTAVTTCKGLIQAHHTSALTELPRLSLNGDFQKSRYVKVMLSGVPFACWGLLQRLWPTLPGRLIGGRRWPSPAHTST